MVNPRAWCRWCGHWVSEHDRETGACTVCPPGECPEPVTAWPLSLDQAVVLIALGALLMVLVAWGLRWYQSQ